MSLQKEVDNLVSVRSTSSHGLIRTSCERVKGEETDVQCHTCYEVDMNLTSEVVRGMRRYLWSQQSTEVRWVPCLYYWPVCRDSLDVAFQHEAREVLVKYRCPVI